MMRNAVLIAVMMTGLGSFSAHSAMTVIDQSNLAQAVQQVQQMREQILQMQKTYDSMNGSRGMGGVLNNSALKNQLPQDWQTVYETQNNPANVDAIRQQEQLTGTFTEQMATIRKRETEKVYRDKAMNMQAYQAMQQRLENIDGLLAMVDTATDSKAIQDLQARIAIEQAAIQNEQTKLQLMSMLQQSEQNLIEQQKKDAENNVFSNTSGTTPRF
jgi:type IV secretion system protein VirB5